MPRIIDRYVIREVIPPFLLALLVFTFVLIIPFIIDLAEQMIAKGVPAGTILQLAVTLLPQALAGQLADNGRSPCCRASSTGT